MTPCFANKCGDLQREKRLDRASWEHSLTACHRRRKYCWGLRRWRLLIGGSDRADVSCKGIKVDRVALAIVGRDWR